MAFDVKTINSNSLSAVESSKANLLIEKAASLMYVTLPVFMGDLRQPVGLLRELRCVVQRQQEGRMDVQRVGTEEGGSASARCLGL